MKIILSSYRNNEPELVCQRNTSPRHKYLNRISEVGCIGSRLPLQSRIFHSIALPA